MNIVASLVSIICTAIAAQTANKYFKFKPRLFTIMALFAFVWALLIEYYSENDKKSSSELMSAYGGFILVYIGGILFLDANETKNDRSSVTNVSTIQRLGLWLFLLIASPSLIKLSTGNGDLGLTRLQQETLIATLLDIAGYLSIAYGFRKWCNKKDPSALLLVLLFLYSASEVIYTILFWPPSGAASTTISPETFPVSTTLWASIFKGIFSVLKLCFTLIFCFGVSKYGLPKGERPESFGLYLWKLIPFTN